MKLNEKPRTRNRPKPFSCSDELWEEILEKRNDCVSVSKFIRDAVEERLSKNYFRFL